MRRPLALAAAVFLSLAAPVAAGDLPTREPPVFTVSPWRDFADAQIVTETFHLPSQARDYLMRRFGRLPWTFTPDARSPFADPVTVEAIEPVREDGAYASFWGIRAIGHRGGDRYGEPVSYVMGPLVRAMGNGFDPWTERAMADKYTSGVYRPLGGCPAYRYGDPRPAC